MDVETARADFERRQVDVGCLHADAMLFDDILTMIEELQAQVAELSAMRDTLNAVFTIEAPPAAPEYGICQRCNGTGKWTDNIGTVRLCGACDGLGEVQP
jgi:hypothetical protein